MLDHAVGINTESGLAIGLLFEMSPDVHARAVPPDEERLVIVGGPFHEVQGPCRHFFVDGFHALLRQRAGILDATVGEAVDHTAGSEFLLQRLAIGKHEIGRVVRMLRLLLGIQVVEIAEKLIEAVVGRQHLVEVAQVILAELSRGVALGFQQPGNRRIFDLHTLRRAR